MVWAEDEPSTKCESAVDEEGAKEEAKDRRESLFECDDKHVVSPEKAEVS